MSNPFSLVNDEFAINWNSTHRTESQRKATLGDPTKFNGEAYNAISRAHEAVTNGLDKISGLVKDPTRTEVSKHAVAKEVAQKTIAVVRESAAVISAVSQSLNRTAKESIDEAFAVDPNRASIQSEVRGWIRETAKTEGGIATIRKAIGESAEVAAVLYHSPNFLLGLADEVRLNLVTDGIERYVPKAFKMVSEADGLDALATKYAAVAGVLKRTFYSEALADQAKLRVEA